MEVTPLRDLCIFRHGGTPSKAVPEYWQGETPWVSPKDFKGAEILDATDHISKEAISRSATSVVPPGAILLVVRSGILAHTLPVARVVRPVAFNQDIKAVIPRSKEVNPDFLYWFLRASANKVISRGVKKGATVHSVQSGFIENLLVPMLSPEEQARIVDVFSRAESIIRLRRDAQKKAAELIPAIFIDMFGDPATNPRGWPTATLGELVSSIDSGKSPKCNDRAKCGEEFGVLRLSALSGSEYDERQHKALPADIEPDLAHEVRSGDLLISRKNTTELVGVAAYVWNTAGKILLPDLIFRLNFKPDSGALALYVWTYLGTPPLRNRLRSLASGSAASMPNISKARLRTLQVQLPPLPLQKTFGERLENIAAIQAQQSVALQKATDTFNALLARTFAASSS